MMALLDRLDLVAEGALSALSDACGVAPDEVASRVKLLRSFDPKPGLAFDDPPQPVRAPDLIATRLGDDWTLALNDATLPSITVREDRLCGAEARTRFVAEALASARGLKRAIEYRNANTLAVAAEIIKRQTPFCARRSDDLAALSLRQIADATGLHESTVSRIVAGVAVQTPRGVLALRDLFCRALEGRDGAPQVSIAFVRSRIRTMIEGERRGAPLTDAAIVKRLAGHGVRISRRTVAKYRAQLGLPGAPERRRRAE
jgi:RNA polymerase sigma-54 factor